MDVQQSRPGRRKRVRAWMVAAAAVSLAAGALAVAGSQSSYGATADTASHSATALTMCSSSCWRTTPPTT